MKKHYSLLIWLLFSNLTFSDVLLKELLVSDPDAATNLLLLKHYITQDGMDYWALTNLDNRVINYPDHVAEVGKTEVVIHKFGYGFVYEVYSFKIPNYQRSYVLGE